MAQAIQAPAVPSTQPPARTGWVLYDGSCGFCLKCLRVARGALEKRGFACEPLQAGWVAERLGLTKEEVTATFRVLSVEGGQHNGADAYLFLFRRIWYLWPLGMLFGCPGFYGLFARAYGWVASNRYRISGTCALPGKPPQ
ncbi:MAG: DUF393 domain-containing protein [Planctomycetes bacterium]|nr:DUF393 domain-containing protein [Planctomycetota bacterium]